jgi:hypothetical protein
MQKRIVWVRSAGRCAACNKLLTEGPLTRGEMTIGELAHIVGQLDTAESPRGISDMTPDERDSAENLILICADDHDDIDRDGSVDLMTVERLREMKRRHEARIEQVTGLAPEHRTAVLRMLGLVRGERIDVSRKLAAEAVIATELRFPDFPLTFDRYGIEIDLRQLPGELEAGPAYWGAATMKIDEEIAHRLADALRDGHVDRLSVFASARLPLLVYLGSKLDDGYPVTIYQRHRSSEGWEWPSRERLDFDVIASDDLAGEEAVLVLNVTGSVQRTELPNELAGMAIWEIRPRTGIPGPDTIASSETLDAFSGAVRGALAAIEAASKQVRRLHVIAALPVSAGVALGRAHDAHVHPALVIYDRTPTGYRIALGIG